MHTKEIGDTTFHHNGDYAGDVMICEGLSRRSVDVPFADLKAFVDGYYVDKIAGLGESGAWDSVTRAVVLALKGDE